MKRNDKNNPQGYGYPQQNGYPQDNFQGYSAPQGYQASQGYPQATGYTQGYPQAQGYPQPTYFRQNQGYQQNGGYQQNTGYQPNAGFQQPQGYGQAQGFNAGSPYQTPQVPTPQAEQATAASEPVQAPYAQGGYPQQGGQGYGQAPQGMPGPVYPQQNGYPRQNPAGYGYGGNQPQAGSYIPQTPSYTQPYNTTMQGYPQVNGYTQGYPSYNTQMGRNPQAAFNPNQNMDGRVPLNGGGYVPQPVPVRKAPFELKDTYLLIASAVLLIMFALGMFAAGMSFLKVPFVLLAAGAAAAMWIKPMTDDNKRLCFTIVFGLLVLVTIIGFVTSGMGGSRRSNTQQQAAMSQAGVPDPTAAAGYEQPAPPTVAPVEATLSPEQDESKRTADRAIEFVQAWGNNDFDAMLKLISPKWIANSNNPRNDLFSALGVKTPVDVSFVQINGTVNDTSRGVVLDVEMNNNNGKDNSRYRVTIQMEVLDGVWYVDPESLRSNEKVTDTPKPTLTQAPTPVAYPDTVLFYNPKNGSYYHLDPNCKAVDKKYLPLQGSFMFKEIDQEPYKNLVRCNTCAAPLRPTYRPTND